MATFELVISLLLACALLTLLAQRLRVPYPALLALAGAALALVPGIPAVSLDPELALALFVAPVLLDAAYDSSPRDLRDNWLPVSGLVLLAVGLTVAAVAVTARVIVPGMPWPVAIALGAIVAPPDAAAATAVLRQLSPPHRVMVILEGESLLNDASALLIYRLAVGAAVTGSFSLWQAVPTLLLTCLGGLAFGWGLARLYMRCIPGIDDIPVSVLVQFLATFSVWIFADRLGVSAVIATVAYAITLARRASGRFDARHRRASYAVWDVAVFVLNALAFILVGLQLRTIVQRLDSGAWTLAVFAASVLAAVVAVRIAVVMTSNTLVRWKQRRFGVRLPRPMMLPTAQTGLVISWCGMRGIVTLAAALALPDGTHGGAVFPYRDLAVAASFAVVLGTLVVQGLTLRPLLLTLRLGTDGAVEREVAMARAATARAALKALDGHKDTEVGGVLAREYRQRKRAAIADLPQSEPDEPGFAALLRLSVAAEREALAALHASDQIGEDAFHLVEEELDWAEVNARLRA
jgi:Na+/H+ antiporter